MARCDSTLGCRNFFVGGGMARKVGRVVPNAPRIAGRGASFMSAHLSKSGGLAAAGCLLRQGYEAQEGQPALPADLPCLG